MAPTTTAKSKAAKSSGKRMEKVVIKKVKNSQTGTYMYILQAALIANGHLNKKWNKE
jgi:hypothetical protein